MATLKIISDRDCKLYIDQEFVCEMLANKLVKHEMVPGMYIVDVIVNDESRLINNESFDLEIIEPGQQILKRITFASAEKTIVSKDEENKEDDFSNNPDLIFYNGFALVSKGNKYGFVDKSFKWVIEPQFDVAEPLRNGHSIVCKMFDGKQKLSLLDSQCKMTLGMWFDEILYKTTDYFVVRRQDELFKIDLQRMVYVDVWHLEGHVYENKPIAVSISNDISKRYGFIDIKGNAVLPFIYDYVSDFSDTGWAEVERYGIRRYINQEGDVNVLNTLEDIEAKAKHFYVIKLSKKYDWEEPFEWCGYLESPDTYDFFLGGVYRFPVRKNGKWGYACLKEERYNGPNTIKMMLDCNYEQFLSNSKFGYVIAKEGDYLSVVNLIGAKYARGEKEGQYVYGPMGECLFKMKCQGMYPINNMEPEWVDDGAALRWREYKFTFDSIVVKINGEYGIINRFGQEILAPIYDNIYYQKYNEEPIKLFSSQTVIVEKDNLKGLFSHKGKKFLDIQYREIYAIGEMWCVRKDKYYQLFDANDNHFVDCEFDDIKLIEDSVDYYDGNSFSFTHYIISKDKKVGSINQKGELAVKCEYDKIDVVKVSDMCDYVLMTRKNGNVGVISTDHHTIIPCMFEEIVFMDEFGIKAYLVRKNGKLSLWNLEGKQLTEFLFESISYLNINYGYLDFRKGKKHALWSDGFFTDFLFDEIKDISESHINDELVAIFLVRIGNLYGIVDERGNMLVNVEFEEIKFFEDWKGIPIFKAQKHNKWGIVSESSIEVEFLFEDIWPINNNDFDLLANYYVVVNNGRKAIFDSNIEKTITKFEFQEIKYFENAGFSVCKDSKWGFVDLKGVLRIGCFYDGIIPCKDSTNVIFAYIVRRNEKKGVINTNQELLVDIIYDNVNFDNTGKNIFFYYNNNTGDTCFGSPHKALLLAPLKEIQLESIRPSDCIKELKESGY